MISGAFKCDGIGFELSVPEKFRRSSASAQTPGSCFSSKQASNASDFVANVIGEECLEKYTEFPDKFSKS